MRNNGPDLLGAVFVAWGQESRWKTFSWLHAGCMRIWGGLGPTTALGQQVSLWGLAEEGRVPDGLRIIL